MADAPRVVLLPGDGVGPEVAEQARLVLELLTPDVELEEHLIGAAAIRATGNQKSRHAATALTAVLNRFNRSARSSRRKMISQLSAR